MASTSDYLEVDFLAVETTKSGDAITIRYNMNGAPFIHVVDGGFLDMGEKIKEHIDFYYTNQTYIDHVVLTHPDQDHANGLRYVLENCDVRNLWMNRPWLYAAELLPRFKNYTNADNLAARLRECFPSAAALEDIANAEGIPIHEAFQGQGIGVFHVMAPSRSRYLDLIVEHEKTPAPVKESAMASGLIEALTGFAKAAVNLVKAAWGAEVFSDQPTSRQNEMSVVQYTNFNGTKFLLTGDAGREALEEVIAYAPSIGLALPGIDRFQVPHHGSRRNVSTEILDTLLGERLSSPTSTYNFNAMISSAKEDKDHPRKSVVRAMHHRGGFVAATEGNSLSSGVNAPARAGWNAADGLPYYEDQEE